MREENARHFFALYGKTYEGRLIKGGLHRFEDRKEKQFMLENYYA